MTAKEIQFAHNAIVQHMYTWAYAEYRAGDYLEQFQLNNCHAEIYETKLFRILVSYDTVVAFILKPTNTLYDCLRWVYGYTAKSSQRITKFAKLYNATERYTYK